MDVEKLGAWQERSLLVLMSSHVQCVRQVFRRSSLRQAETPGSCDGLRTGGILWTSEGCRKRLLDESDRNGVERTGEVGRVTGEDGGSISGVMDGITCGAAR